MRFIAVHKAASYLMVLTGLLALLSPGEISPAITVLTLAGVVASWWWEPPKVDLARFDLPWNALTIGVLGWTLFDMFSGGSVLIAAVHFVLYLSLNKLFNRRESRDYQQLYVLSFLQMVAATVINTDLAYGALFLVYVVATTWTLILFHLKREMEENFLLKYGDTLEGRPVQVHRVMNSRKLVGGRFLGITSLLSLLVFAGALAIFFAFPRVGFGFFFKKQRSGIAMTGFSDEVELGHFGLIKNNPTVVMRVEFPGGRRHRLAPYWRGIALDHYDGTRWRKSDPDNRCEIDRKGGRYQIFGQQLTAPRCTHDTHAAARADTAAGPTVEQRIYLEPMNAHVVFGLNQMQRLTMPRGPLPSAHPTSIRLHAEGDLRYTQYDETAFRYSVFSHHVPPEPHLLSADLEQFRAALPPDIQRRYLQRPDLAPRITALARSIIGDAQTVQDAIDRVATHLRQNYAYTLNLGRDPSLPPLEDFLFVQRRGHCEYFATAMIILLRAVGIPARNVNGFLGGRWNPYGEYLSVSQGDAHAWVEVWLAPGQWLTQDPTPPGSGRAAAPGLLSKLRAYTDAMRLRWFKHVVEYDLKNQIGAFKALRDRWQAARRTLRSGTLRQQLRTLSIWLGAPLGLLAMFLLLRRLRWRQTHRSPEAQRAQIADLFERLTARYARLGFPPTGPETARECIHRLEAAQAPDLAIAHEIGELYERVRFAGASAEPQQIRQLSRALRQIGRTR